MRDVFDELFAMSGATMRDCDFECVEAALSGGPRHVINGTFIVETGKVFVKPERLSVGDHTLIAAVSAANAAIRESVGVR